MTNVRRNVLFACLCLLGIGSLCANFLPQPRIRLDGVNSEAWTVAESSAAVVNAAFEASWENENIQTAPKANNLAIARRISLALTGTLPSLEEIRAFEAVSPGQQIQWWTDRLLQDRRSSDYLAERFARAFVGTEDGPFLVYRRRRFVTWLSDQFHENQRYDKIVRELIAGKGLWTDSPAVNFLTVTNDINGDENPDEERLAARTTRAFLGVRLDCVQCHDDNLDGNWRQRDFHQLAAFYTESRSSLLGISDKKDAEYEYTYLNETDSEVVDPSFPFCHDIDAESETRRETLANWVTHPDNKAFSRAIVNRVWALLFGRPLVTPIDSIPLEGPYPAGLEELADQFCASACDLRQLIRTIVATNVFQADSRAPFDVTKKHEEHWAVFPITRLRPEQVAGSILQASSLTTIDADSHIIVKLTRFDEQDKFVKRYGDTGDDEFDAHGGTIPQRLLMLNGNLVKERTKDDLVMNATARISTLTRSDERAIEAAYLCVLTRQPSAAELHHFVSLLADGDREKEIEDLFWVLFNSAEFSWNH
ncbi:MAG: DUF1553 domain-containing protein [Planctomycetales bacterium]|nr:DUF1553 domain-containing protein [Planctomycetales bacterium]